ncbi:MAG: tyrosine-type recombinase/integrase [Pedobacter sp.]|nr:tyrosine-type recombinase/integrase [Pedobacter sp.]
MSYEIRIVTSNDLNKRSYVTFYYKGKRVREYNGNNIGIDLKPNYAKTIRERSKLLKQLEHEIIKVLEQDMYPLSTGAEFISEAVDKIPTTLSLLKNALDKKLNSSLSKFYKRNMKYIHDNLVSFLTDQELQGPIISLKTKRIEEFLSRYKTSGTYYMNKRRDLTVLFSSISKEIEQPLLIIKNTDRMKSQARLHQIYRKEQLQPILEYLKVNNPNLYLCCLITYGCFLRPHEEIRKLCFSHIKKDFTEIHLSGAENKGRKVRVVSIPLYVRQVLKERWTEQPQEFNIFTNSTKPFNDAYFNTQWKRCWDKMYKLNLVETNQTLYSFRHTAAVNVYHKTKDVHILQQLLGHSDMIVTLKYLRGLGELNSDKLKEVMPELDI